MRKLFLFVMDHRRAFTLFATLFISISMMAMGESSKTHFTRTVTTAVFNTGRFTFSWGIYLTDLWSENRRLRLQNLDLADKAYYADFVLKENARLRNMLELKDKRLIGVPVTAASVIGRDSDVISNSLILNVGSSDGIRPNMTVITAEGLVGRIFEVYRSSCSVLVLMDINSKVSAVVDDINGIVSWEGGNRLMMYGLPLSNVPKPGKKIYTTGDGGIYPGGIFIGTVSAEKVNEVDLYASVNVDPAVDFNRVQEVFIIKGSDRLDIWNVGPGTGQFTRPSVN